MTEEFRCGHCFKVFGIDDGERRHAGIGGPVVWLCFKCLREASSIPMIDFVAMPLETRQRIWDRAMKEGMRLTDVMGRYPWLV